MRKYMIERTDGETDHILAESYYITGGAIIFIESNKDGLVDEYGGELQHNAYTYILSNTVRIVDLGEVKEEEQSKDPERHKNDNEDLISRSKLLSFLRNHWSSNVIEVIESFEKAEFLD